MNALQTHSALLAATKRHAIPKATRLHVHLSPRPMVIVGYHLAGDPGAPLALMWGTDPADPHCVVVPEPRNRGLRFEALDAFAEEFLAYLAGFEARDGAGLCVDAPQIVVPNPATTDWLGGIVGRFTRNLRTDGDSPAPPNVPLAGKHLSFFGDLLPGSCLAIVATDALTAHWQTGQLPAETLNLPAVLGWIDPPNGMDALQAARTAELAPPAGPVSEPNWDADHLAPLIQAWHDAPDEAARSAVRAELEAQVREQLSTAWTASWHARDCLATLPPAEHVASRWERDRREWTVHCDRIAAGNAHFRNIPTPIQAARRLRLLEERTEKLPREMAWDDRLVMAGFIASGEALAGRVVTVDLDRRIPNAKGNPVRRPLMVIQPAIEFTRPAGTPLFLSTAPSVRLELLDHDSVGVIRAVVVEGANQKNTIERLPRPGDNVILTPFGKPEFYRPPKVEEIPWTHLIVDQDLEATS